MGHSARSFLSRTLGYFLVLEGMLAAAILYWPNFRDNIGSLRAMAPLPVLKDLVDRLGEGGVAAYVVGQQFFKGCNTLGTAAAVLFSMAAVAGEVQRGTLEIWLARPLSRRRILTERFAAGALATTVPIFLTTATIPWLLSYVDERTELWPMLLCAAHQSLFLLSVYAVTFLLSTLGRNPTGIALAVLFFTTFQFAIYLVKTATHYSLFRLVDLERFMRIVRHEKLEWSVAGPLVLFTAACYLASLWAFARRVP